MTNDVVFPYDEAPDVDRFDRWREMMAPHLRMDRIDEAADFPLHQRFLELGPIWAWGITSGPMTYHRTPKLIGQHDPEAYHLTLMLRGGGAFDCGDGEMTLAPGNLYAGNTSIPYHGRITDGRDPSTYFGLMVPRKLLPLPRKKADRAIGTSMSGREGFGALLAGVLTRVTEDAAAYQPSDRPHLATVLTDLMAAMFARVSGDERSVPPETYARTLVLRIRAFIQQHLHDPRLTPGAIAAAHHISPSYLHRLFQERGVTVASWIRHQRLERARDDLADAAKHLVPVHQIASRWGFTHAAAFSRAFRAAYGLPPREYRQRALSADHG